MRVSALRMENKFYLKSFLTVNFKRLHFDNLKKKIGSLKVSSGGKWRWK